MIQITPHMRILVAVEPIDFRAGIDGRLAGVLACRGRSPAPGAGSPPGTSPGTQAARRLSGLPTYSERAKAVTIAPV
jgi:hypothetical protein